MSNSYVLTDRFNPDISYTLGVDGYFLRILVIHHIDVTEVSQKDFETFLGILSILRPEITVKRRVVSRYVLRYE